MVFIVDRKHFGPYMYEHWFDTQYGNDNDIITGRLQIEEIDFVSNMINSLFDKFAGKDYPEEVNNTSKDYITPQNIADRFNESESLFFVAKYNYEIVGMLEIKNNSHISLFFIKEEFQGKYIGKKLFEHYLGTMKNEKSGK